MCPTTPKPLQVYFEYFTALALRALLLFVTCSGVERAEFLIASFTGDRRPDTIIRNISSVGYL